MYTRKARTAPVDGSVATYMPDPSSKTAPKSPLSSTVTPNPLQAPSAVVVSTIVRNAGLSGV
eukprot:474417-Prymnesium_polylepis.1